MSSSDESIENIEAEDINVVARLSSRSKELYFRAYDEFIKWKNSRSSVAPFSEDLFLEYFRDMAQSKKPTTLWSIYSMLKATVCVKHDIHMNTYKSLLIFLKNESKGHQSKKSKTFTSQNIDTFLKEAPDYSYLALKVALIVGVNGACRGNELLNVTVNDVQKHSDHLFLVILPSTKTKRSFVIRDEQVAIVEKYLSLRPAHMKTDRLFLHYLNGKCTRQVIGKNKIGTMPREIAKYLKLPNPELYTGHCFRRTAAALAITADYVNLSMDIEHSGNSGMMEVIIEDVCQSELKMSSPTVEVKIEPFDSPTDPWAQQDAVTSKATSSLRESSPLLTESNQCLHHEVVIKQEWNTEIISIKEDIEIDLSVANIKKENRSELIVVASLIDKLPNLGGMARTSEVFGVKTYVVDSLRHLQDKQFQSLSVSAERWIDVEEVRPGPPLKQYLMTKKSEGYSVVAAEQTSTSVKLQEFQFPVKTLLLLGHEKEGIPCDLLPMMDYCVEIPQQGFVRSLNVHVTAAIFVWEYARQNIL